MMDKREVLKWLRAVKDGESIAVDEDGMRLVSTAGDWLEIGALPEEWETVCAVAFELRRVQGTIEWDTKPFNQTDGALDVRLQVEDNGSWSIHTGDASYDTDHHGFWGAGSMGKDTDVRELARELVDEALDHKAEVES